MLYKFFKTTYIFQTFFKTEFICNFQNVDDNDEAEQIIRAITHGEMPQEMYSQMADDLENAAKIKRKTDSKSKKKKKKPKTDATKSASELESSSSTNLVSA